MGASIFGDRFGDSISWASRSMGGWSLDAETLGRCGPAHSFGEAVTLGQRHRFRRNLTLFVAHRGGVPTHVLADAFVLSRARVRTIVNELSQIEAERSQVGLPELGLPGTRSEPKAPKKLARPGGRG